MPVRRNTLPTRVVTLTWGLLLSIGRSSTQSLTWFVLMILTAMRLILNSLSTLKAGLPGLVSASRLAVAHSQLLNTEWHRFQMRSLIECTSLQPCDETSTVTVIDESSTHAHQHTCCRSFSPDGVDPDCDDIFLQVEPISVDSLLTRCCIQGRQGAGL